MYETYKRGQAVIAQTTDGPRHLVVWEDHGSVVSLTSDRGLKILKRGEREVIAIGFCKRDVSPAND